MDGSKRISGPDNVPHHHGREVGAPSATATGTGDGGNRQRGGRRRGARTGENCGRVPRTNTGEQGARGREQGQADEERGPAGEGRRSGKAQLPGARRGRTGGVIAEPQALQQVRPPRPFGIDPDDRPPAAAAWAEQDVEGEEALEQGRPREAGGPRGRRPRARRRGGRPRRPSRRGRPPGGGGGQSARGPRRGEPAGHGTAADGSGGRG
jgi:hypothetical protein